MYPRILKYPDSRSFFLFGPRGTGKSSWLRKHFGSAPYIDLLDDETYRHLLSRPEELKTYFPSGVEWVVIDEVQRVPALLNEVHRLIENNSIKFALSGSSARKLKSAGTNLLAGRALTKYMYTLTIEELGEDFILKKALTSGMLPEIWDSADNKEYLHSYITRYLKEEIQQEGLTRNLGTFSRFLEIASFAQASPLNVTQIAKDIGIDSKTAENYFTILEDLLLAIRIPVFSKHAKREMYRRSKFLYFDVGVYRTLRPKGPLDTPELIDGAALETLLFQEVRAINDYYDLEYEIYYWRTRSKLEIDFVLYGERGIVAIEVKRSSNVKKRDCKALLEFLTDFPIAKAYMFYGGKRRQYIDQVELIPFEEGLLNLKEILS